MHLRHGRGAGRPPARKSAVISSGFEGLTGVADGLLVDAETFDIGPAAHQTGGGPGPGL